MKHHSFQNFQSDPEQMKTHLMYNFYQSFIQFSFIPISIFVQVISVISSGAFGRVLKVIHKDEAKNYAMKLMSKYMVGHLSIW